MRSDTASSDFQFDLFLSHSAKDKAVVRPLAERLRQDGLRVWFDEWVLKPGDNIPAMIEEGLEHSRVLVLCMSATGEKLYLQLKSGDSYLRERKSDGAEIFTIKDERHARYWMAQAFPVLLVIQNAEGEVRWMEVREWLKRETDSGRKPVKQIVFKGERFDVMRVRRWRKKVLAGGATGKG
jgi:hypothetical protein